MADNANSTQNKQLPTFRSTKPFEQLAVVLRSEGKEYSVIANTINSEYDLAYKEITVRNWFTAGGRLEQASSEYNEYLADQAVINAKRKIKRLSEKAADTLDELLESSNAGNVRQQAARTILGKYIPDRQILVDESKADELPAELTEMGDEAVTGGEDGSKQVDDARQGEASDKEAGTGSGESVPPEVLQESTATDGPGDPPS